MSTACQVSSIAPGLTPVSPRVATRTAGVVDAEREVELVRAAQSGCHDAFAELVRRHELRVRRVVLRLCRDAALTDDLVQEVFLRAYRGLHAFEARARLTTWLHRIAVNLVLNHRARVPGVVALPVELDVSIAAPTDARSPQRAALRRDLGLAISRLPEVYRTVVELHYARELGYAEIACVLDVPLGTVKTHLHRAKAQLRGLLPGWSQDAVAA